MASSRNLPPVRPSEFKSCIPAAEDTLGVMIGKVLIKFPVLWLKWYSYAYSADGTISTAFRQKICESMRDCTEDQVVTL